MFGFLVCRTEALKKSVASLVSLITTTSTVLHGIPHSRNGNIHKPLAPLPFRSKTLQSHRLFSYAWGKVSKQLYFFDWFVCTNTIKRKWSSCSSSQHIGKLMVFKHFDGDFLAVPTNPAKVNRGAHCTMILIHVHLIAFSTHINQDKFARVVCFRKIGNHWFWFSSYRTPSQLKVSFFSVRGPWEAIGSLVCLTWCLENLWLFGFFHVYLLASPALPAGVILESNCRLRDDFGEMLLLAWDNLKTDNCFCPQLAWAMVQSGCRSLVDFGRLAVPKCLILLRINWWDWMDSKVHQVPAPSPLHISCKKARRCWQSKHAAAEKVADLKQTA